MEKLELKIDGVRITVVREDDEGGTPQVKTESAARKKAIAPPKRFRSDDYAVQAAIAAAIHLYGQEWRDVENAVLTINKVSRAYSPWSARFHGLNAYYKFGRINTQKSR